MNKFQEALQYSIMQSNRNNWYEKNKLIESQEILKELVDKITPMKVEEKSDIGSRIFLDSSLDNAKCPNCHENVNGHCEYCGHCGQKLRWKEEGTNEKN